MCADPGNRFRAFDAFHCCGFALPRFGAQAHPCISGFVQLQEEAPPMKPLITDAQRAQLLANGRARAEGQALDPLPVVRLFTLDAHAT